MTERTTDPDAGRLEAVKEFEQKTDRAVAEARRLWPHDPQVMMPTHMATAIRDTLAALRERAERADVDARRWRYIRRFLDVDGDVTDPEGVTGTHVQWLIFNDEVPAQEGWTHTVESIVDAALSDSPAPEVRDADR